MPHGVVYELQMRPYLAHLAFSSDRGLEPHDPGPGDHRHGESDRLGGKLVPPGVQPLDGFLEIGEEVVLGAIVQTQHPLDDVRIPFLEHLAQNAIVPHLIIQVHNRLRPDLMVVHPLGYLVPGVRLILEVSLPFTVGLVHDISNELGHVVAYGGPDLRPKRFRRTGQDGGIESVTFRGVSYAELLCGEPEPLLRHPLGVLLAGPEYVPDPLSHLSANVHGVFRGVGDLRPRGGHGLRQRPHETPHPELLQPESDSGQQGP